MYFFVKSHLPADKVNDFTGKIANRQIRAVEGNVSYVTPKSGPIAPSRSRGM